MPKFDGNNLSSEQLTKVKTSATIAVTDMARVLRAQGLDVIGLGVGEPDFDTPQHIKMAAVEALAKGHTKYTAVDGIPSLKQAICDKLSRDNHLSYTPEQISVAPGGKPIIFNALIATLNPGDEVIIPAPCWVSYPEMVRLAGGVPVVVNCPQEQAFKITADDLRSALNERTKWLILNSPSNPTGMVYRTQELSALAEVLREFPHVMILTDDIYEHLIYGGIEFATMAQVAPDLYDRVLTMNGLSKAYAMTGFRIGYGAGPEKLIKLMAKVMAQTTSNPCSISQHASVVALNGSHDFMAARNEIFMERRNRVVDILNQADELDCMVPEGAFYVFPKCEAMLGKTTAGGKLLKTDVDIASAILEEVLVALVPGTAFQAPGHFRISYATDMTSLETACHRILKFCDGLRA